MINKMILNTLEEAKLRASRIAFNNRDNKAEFDKYIQLEEDYGNLIKQLSEPPAKQQTNDKATELIPVVVVSEAELFCQDCRYDKSETYHDKMWCRDCRQKDRFKAK